MRQIFYPILICLFTIGLYSCAEEEALQQATKHRENQRLTVSVFSDEAKQIPLPDAQVQVYHGRQLVGTYSSGQEINALHFTDDPENTYTLKIISPGYAPHSLNFVYTEFQKLAGAPLTVKLKPAVAMVLQTLADDDTYLVEMDGTGVITIVWPDNSTETLAMPFSVSREFDTSSGHMILLTGDLHKISFFRSFGYNTAITKISGLQHLKEMYFFAPGLIRLSEKLDLHHNKNLAQVDIFEATLPDWFRLPQHHAISSIVVTLGDRAITTKEIDVLINNLYKNSTKRRIYGGRISLTNSEPPSATAAARIRILEEQYDWEINLNL